jgi:serine/threonine protein kinase
MQTVQAHEAFKTIDGKFRFRYMQGVLRDGDDLYVAKWNKRTQVDVDASWLYDVRRVLTKDRGPVVKPAWTVAGSASNYYYVKTPGLLDYIEDGLEEQISREVEACEITMKNPHPNLAAYYGCVDTRGRVSGICLKRYQTTLLERLNPQYLNKRAFVSSGRPLVYESLASDLDGILAAIHHLHSLGIVHNDINPANIMLDESGSLVLVDFDSCRFVGEPLAETRTRRTRGWHDSEAKTSLPENDLDAFAELKTWLFGPAHELRFP